MKATLGLQSSVDSAFIYSLKACTFYMMVLNLIVIIARKSPITWYRNTCS